MLVLFQSLHPHPWHPQLLISFRLVLGATHCDTSSDSILSDLDGFDPGEVHNPTWLGLVGCVLSGFSSFLLAVYATGTSSKRKQNAIKIGRVFLAV